MFDRLLDAITIPPLDRYRPLLSAMQVFLFFIAVLFWVEATTVNKAFRPEMWGDFAYQAPAQGWAAMMMAASAMSFVGLIRPIQRHMVIAGSAMHCFQFSVVSYSAAFTGGDFGVAIYASTFFLPLHLWILWESVHHESD